MRFSITTAFVAFLAITACAQPKNTDHMQTYDRLLLRQDYDSLAGMYDQDGVLKIQAGPPYKAAIRFVSFSNLSKVRPS